MSRMSHAKYRNQKVLVSAFDVDDNYDDYTEEDRKQFKCFYCNTKIQFSRGKLHDDPHFKNWPLTDHKKGCLVPNSFTQIKGKTNSIELEILVSTILPRAMRRINPTSPSVVARTTRAKLFGGKQTHKFICEIKKVLDSSNRFAIFDEYKDLKLLTEDNDEVYIKDIILSQDEVIRELDSNGGESFICILKATVSKIREIKGSYIYDMTKSENGNYGNSKNFKLYMHHDFVEKNANRIESISKSLIICYGIASKTDFGYQMDLYSINNQIAVLKTFL